MKERGGGKATSRMVHERRAGMFVAVMNGGAEGGAMSSKQSEAASVWLEMEASNRSTSRSASTRNRPNRVKTARRRQLTEEEQASPSRSPKKLKITTPAPRSTPRQPVANKLVRLRLPSKGKGKAREEEEDDEPKKGLFDDVLGPEDRDVMKTTVSSSDKDRFEKARLHSDVRY